MLSRRRIKNILGNLGDDVARQIGVGERNHGAVNDRARLYFELVDGRIQRDYFDSAPSRASSVLEKLLFVIQRRRGRGLALRRSGAGRRGWRVYCSILLRECEKRGVRIGCLLLCSC